MTPSTAADFDPLAWPRKLNLGCGWDRREGFVNVDLHAWHQPDLVADVRQLGFLPAGHYDEIIAQDVLEHLPRTQTGEVLMHWNRLLRVGGTIFLRVPSVTHIARLMEKRAHQIPAKQEELMQFLFGTQAYTGDFHLTSFTALLLEHYLKIAGFRMGKIEVVHEWLFDVLATKVEHIEGRAVVDVRALLECAGDGPFVRECYRQILQREPDSGGYERFVEHIAAGATRQSVIESMLASAEYQGAGGKLLE